MINQKNVILYVGGFILPDKNAAAQRVLSNSKAMQALGYDVVFLGVNKNLKNNLVKMENKSNFEFWEQKYPKSNKRWLNYITSISNIEHLVNDVYKDKVSAIILYNYPAISMARLITKYKKSQIKIISDATEWYQANTGNIVFRIFKKVDTELRMKILHKKINGVICISDFLGNYYKKYTKTIVIPPLIDKKDKKWERVHIKANNLKFIYAGSPEISKGKYSKDRLDVVIKILYKFKANDFSFEIIGVLKEEYLKSFPEDFKIISEMSDKIKFLGRLNHQEVIEKLKKCDFSIFVRNDNLVTRAGFPTKFVEAISAGVPVITNKSSDLDRYLIEDINGFLVDEGCIYEKMKKIFSMNREDILEMKRNCEINNQFQYELYIDEFNYILK